MDFEKLKELPKFWAAVSVDSDLKTFKSYKKRAEESLGIESDISAMAFCPSSESSQLAVSCGSKVQICDLGFASVSENASWSKHKNIVHCLSYRKDGKLLIAGDGDGSANIYDVAVSKTIIRRLRGHDGAIYAAAFCEDNTRVVTAGKDQTVKVWDVPTGQVSLNLKGHSDSVRCLLTVGSDTVISAGADGNIIKWDISSHHHGEEVQKSAVVVHGHAVDRLALFESGAMFFSLGGGICRLWDLRTMQEVRPATGTKHTKPVTGAVVSACGDFIATSSFDMTLKIVRVSTWEVVVSFTSESPITAMAWSGHSLVYGTEKGTWTLRQRRSNDTVVEASSLLSDKISQERYYKTVEVIDNSSSARGKKESNTDFLLRKFEYRKLVDFVVDTKPAACLALAVFDELIQRGGLVASLRDRPADELVKMVEWCSNFLVIDPRCSVQIIRQVFDALVETNRRVFASAPAGLIKAVKSLNSKISQEMTLQLKAAALAGLLESLV